MKIKASIIEVSDHGDTLKIKAQGKEIGAEHWQPYRALHLEIPCTPQSCKTYHLQREITVEIKPK